MSSYLEFHLTCQFALVLIYAITLAYFIPNHPLTALLFLWLLFIVSPLFHVANIETPQIRTNNVIIYNYSYEFHGQEQFV